MGHGKKVRAVTHYSYGQMNCKKGCTPTSTHGCWLAAAETNLILSARCTNTSTYCEPICAASGASKSSHGEGPATCLCRRVEHIVNIEPRQGKQH
jgi:hypothetical protein